MTEPAKFAAPRWAVVNPQWLQRAAGRCPRRCLQSGHEQFPPPIRGGRARACDVFALSFTKKTIGPASSTGKPGHILLRIIPQDADYRSLPAPPVLVKGLVAAALP